MTKAAHWKLKDIPANKRDLIAHQLSQMLQPDGDEMPEGISEKKLQSLCELELHRRDIPYLHLSPKAREKKGWPDLTFCICSHDEAWPCAVELKSATGKLSNDQTLMLRKMAHNCWHTYVMQSFDTFLELLNGNEPVEWSGL